MNFNGYRLYSVISDTENKCNNELEKITSLVNQISKFKTIETVKNFLEQTYRINDNVHKIQLCRAGVLHIKETDEKYSLRILYTNLDKENECIIYNFKK